MATDDFCYLTTTGRRTGRPHRIEIWFAADGDTRYFLAGGGRSSDWVQNLVASADVLVEQDGELREGRGRIVDDEAEAEHARSLVFDKYQPRYDGDLASWRGSALPLAVDLVRHDGR